MSCAFVVKVLTIQCTVFCSGTVYSQIVVVFLFAFSKVGQKLKNARVYKRGNIGEEDAIMGMLLAPLQGSSHKMAATPCS